jgi:hypothetical protein
MGRSWSGECLMVVVEEMKSFANFRRNEQPLPIFFLAHLITCGWRKHGHNFAVNTTGKAEPNIWRIVDKQKLQISTPPVPLTLHPSNPNDMASDMGTLVQLLEATLDHRQHKQGKFFDVEAPCRASSSLYQRRSRSRPKRRNLSSRFSCSI